MVSQKNILPQTEQRTLNILDKTTANTNNRYTDGLLWGEDNFKLPDNENLTVSRLFSLERKFKNHPILETSYKDTM